MTKRILALALLVLTALPAAAQADATIIEPLGGSYPLQIWVNRAYVPTPDVTLTVHDTLVGKPCLEEHARGCTDLTSIWLPHTNREEAHFIFMHEMGHNYDVDSLSVSARERVAALLHEPVWFPGYSEQFADSYAFCAVKQHITTWWIEGISANRLRRICGVIRNAPPAPPTISAESTPETVFPTVGYVPEVIRPHR